MSVAWPLPSWESVSSRRANQGKGHIDSGCRLRQAVCLQLLNAPGYATFAACRALQRQRAPRRPPSSALGHGWKAGPAVIEQYSTFESEQHACCMCTHSFFEEPRWVARVLAVSWWQGRCRWCHWLLYIYISLYIWMVKPWVNVAPLCLFPTVLPSLYMYNTYMLVLLPAGNRSRPGTCWTTCIKHRQHN